MAAKKWLESQPDAPWNDPNNNIGQENYQFPEYYTKSFHAYSEGNLSYDAAFEQELASRAIGARNFPKFKECGEDVFRGAFDKALINLGAAIISGDEKDAVIVDFGCGTGTSTRRLADQYPKATNLIGIDLSPYFIDVGKTLLKLAPDAISNGGTDGWVTKVNADPRIQLQQGNIASTNLPSNFASAVNIGLVLHELPTYVARDVILEAHRILKPGGQLWISEMDFESPAYKAQRENAMLFSLLRATEPYLDEYADGMPKLRDFIVDTFCGDNRSNSVGNGFVKIAAATGRHYALLAKKGDSNQSKAENSSLQDNRFLEDGRYALEDTHLKPWESKEV
jgi:ubiquinone/menaquinone biosynthesis C-methylase UbiE